MPVLYPKLEEITEESRAPSNQSTMQNYKAALSDESSSNKHQNDRREITDLSGNTYSTIPPGFWPVITLPAEGRRDKKSEDLTVIAPSSKTAFTRGEVLTVGGNRLAPFTTWGKNVVVSRVTLTPSSTLYSTLYSTYVMTVPPSSTSNDELVPTSLTSSEELVPISSTSQRWPSPTAAETQDSPLSTIGWIGILVGVVSMFIVILVAVLVLVLRRRGRSKDNQNNINIRLGNRPFSPAAAEAQEPRELQESAPEPAPAYGKL
ncbi:hypothetical protein F53441_8954 [Fusarium austroafricanum]|uniref:Uncharacterized protein n=1 Tax=Fusarium austroafricanum TaxID=2364996 RepID=A0A8H4KC10_9HYPO|nr:hypothetical protein F53441_8954 [Fusarium austroafricanum]